jgi:hypothetical protein
VRHFISWKLAKRQLTIKSHESHSWFIEIKELCLKYDILNIYNYLENPLSKNQWKKMIKTEIYTLLLGVTLFTFCIYEMPGQILPPTWGTNH